ncbi:MAG: M20/M25/M40 family metallo-hydrolase [Alphaproteobacteria bacterium]|nr:M20/M25/M40 family metallo-hydrolase [Alphaproteobacteria bacterium]MDE2494632.1 M20/M25/M40 family metallo-hydrolase [Alphaproteobacteria bacterium]
MRAVVGLACTGFLLAAAQAADRPAVPPDHPLLHAVAADVQPAALQATVAKLVGFGTRHTMSIATSETRGIGAARRWVKSRFEEIGKACGGCVQIDTPTQTVAGSRVPKPTEIMDVLAIQPGTTDPGRYIVVSAHLDSRVTDVMNAASDAPGADDDGSGVAAVIEAARVLSAHKFPATLVYAVLSGEEQDLYGGKLLAQYAKARHWRVEADLNNDIVGNIAGENGLTDANHVRVFSEGTRSTETPEQAARRRYNGGEVDSPSRNLARFVAGMAEGYLKNFSVRMIYRTDRYGRGGDQVEMLAAGYPAVRFTEAVENYTHEHQDLRTENGIAYGDRLEYVNFPYLAQVARLNIVSMAALAMAPAPPATVKIEGAVAHDTTVSWTPAPGAASYRVWWRSTIAPFWTDSRSAGAATSLVLKNITIDDWFFGVSSVSADDYASPVEFPGAAGAFFEPPPPAAH